MDLNNIATRTLKFLSSLKLAVFVILAIGVLSAWGTIVEAQYNSQIATKVVYHSIWMVGTLALLTINLIAVIVDRYPWKRHHLGFILAHIGIIVLIVGSVVTHRIGVDGSMRIGLNESERYVSIPTTDFTVWGTFDGDKWARLFEKEVDFYMDRPSKEKPFEISMPDGKMRVIDYIPFSLEDRKIAKSEDKKAGPALRFQLQNDNVNLSQWIQLKDMDSAPAVLNLGPAKVVLHSGDYKPTGGNEILLKAGTNKDYLSYEILSQREGKVPVRGEIRSGDAIETGWMGLKFRALKFLPRAKENVKFVPRDRPTELTRAAILIDYRGEKHWMAQDSMVKFFTEEAGFVVTFGRRRIDIGFDMKLLDFRIDRYQGTRRAATYESDVDVPGIGKVNISMNEPLKHKGLTFYQSSYIDDPKTGEPVASILSVNKDPGRFWKYLGSALIVLGCIVMFYFKRTFARKRKTA